jgi:phosphoesterase RecJ-like protein
MKLEALERSRDLLAGCSRPLLVTHIAPDGDAVGSLLGLGWALRVQGAAATLTCQDPLPIRFDFLPGFNEVTSEPEGDFDLLVSLDCSSPDRMGSIESHTGSVPLLNIDHHVTNLDFGTVNLVDAEAVSTTHILYDLISDLGVALDERIATCLLTGLTTDTRGFRTSNVTSDVMRIALELMEAGALLPVITRNGLDRRPVGALRLWGAGLSRLKVVDGVVWASLPLEVQRAIGCEGLGDAGLTNLLLSAEEANVAVVFVETSNGQVEVGIRSVPGFDVSGIALELGGGGHPRASGCRVSGPLEEAEKRILAMLREELTRQRERKSGDDGRNS